jgi:hypothetical protein
VQIYRSSICDRPNLILVQILIAVTVALLLECNDDERYEDVHEEKWKHDEEQHIVECNFDTEEWRRTAVFFGGVDGQLSNAAPGEWIRVCACARVRTHPGHPSPVVTTNSVSNELSVLS